MATEEDVYCHDLKADKIEFGLTTVKVTFKATTLKNEEEKTYSPFS